MKKLFVAATLVLALVSCGGPSVCDCVEAELSGKMDKDQKKECNDLQKSMTPEEALKAMADCAK
jgi:hypothetical protein